MTKPESSASAAASAGRPGHAGRLRWVLGWVAIPATLVLVLFLAGVHVGARHPDLWLSRFMMWLFT